MSGKTVAKIVENSKPKVTGAVVHAGLKALLLRSPAGWAKVFYERGKANDAREEAVPLKGRPIPESERRWRDDRVLLLGRSGMSVRKIAALVGYDVEYVARLLGQLVPADIAPVDVELKTEAGVLVVRGRHPHLVTVAGDALIRDSRRVVVSDRQYEVLAYMATRRGHVVEPGELAAAVWQRTDALVVARATISGLRSKIGGDVISTARGGYRLGPPQADDADNVERQQLLRALADADWNLARAAERLGVPRSTLHYRTVRYGLARNASPSEAQATIGMPSPQPSVSPAAQI